MTGTCPHGWTFAHNCPTQPAPDLSDYERGVVERIEAAEAAPESLRERVAEVLIGAGLGGMQMTELRHIADAAIAAIRGET